MAHDSSASLREGTSVSPKEETNSSAQTSDNHKASSQPKASSQNSNAVSDQSQTIDASLKRRARLLITDSLIPRPTRSLIQYALQLKDPYLAQLVRRVESGETTIDHVHLE